jgi:hypothetical protein
MGRVSPSEVLPSLSEDEILGNFEELVWQLEEEFQPSILGEIIVSQKKWCSAKYLIEAIIYDVNQENLVNFDLLEYALEGVWIEVFQLKLRSVAMVPFGTEYGIISCERFTQMLYQLFEKYPEEIRSLEKMVLAPRNTKDLYALKEALHRYFGIQASFYA